ncbi:MAG: hypothetical protein ACRD3J_20385, partial [Thermoanaerobaculia bacterium]
MRRSLITVILLLSGCVHLVVRPFDAAKDTDAHGVRFYRPAPYMWLAADEKGRCSPTITYLPDPSQEFIMQVKPEWFGIGTVSMKPTLQDGWNLTSLDSSVDTKFPETLTAVAGLVSAAMGGGGGGKGAKLAITPSATNLGPGLYRVELTADKSVPLKFTQVMSFTNADGSPVLCSTLGPPAQPQKPNAGGSDDGAMPAKKPHPKRRTDAVH